MKTIVKGKDDRQVKRRKDCFQCIFNAQKKIMTTTMPGNNEHIGRYLTIFSQLKNNNLYIEERELNFSNLYYSLLSKSESERVRERERETDR